MDHVKKLMLVDPATMQHAATTPPATLPPATLPHTLYRPTPIDRKLSSLDADVSSILNSDLPDDEKAKHYLLALRRYRHFEAAPSEKPDPVKDILTSVKPDLQIKAKRLLKQIKPHIRWSEEGELVTDENELVPDSSLAELLNEASSKESKDDVIGLQEFAKTLKRSDTPKHLIWNERLRRYMRAVKRKRNIHPPARPKRRRIHWEAD
jgi:hypothetical protein